MYGWSDMSYNPEYPNTTVLWTVNSHVIRLISDRLYEPWFNRCTNCGVDLCDMVLSSFLYDVHQLRGYSRPQSMMGKMCEYQTQDDITQLIKYLNLIWHQKHAMSNLIWHQKLCLIWSKNSTQSKSRALNLVLPGNSSLGKCRPGQAGFRWPRISPAASNQHAFVFANNDTAPCFLMNPPPYIYILYTS